MKKYSCKAHTMLAVPLFVITFESFVCQIGVPVYFIVFVSSIIFAKWVLKFRLHKKGTQDNLNIRAIFVPFLDYLTLRNNIKALLYKLFKSLDTVRNLSIVGA